MSWVIVLLVLARSALSIVEIVEVHDHLTNRVPSRDVVTDGFGELSLLTSLRMGLSVSQLAAQPPRAGSPGSLCQKQALRLVFLHL